MTARRNTIAAVVALALLALPIPAKAADLPRFVAMMESAVEDRDAKAAALLGVRIPN